jgi:signal transduction histidine kinase
VFDFAALPWASKRRAVLRAAQGRRFGLLRFYALATLPALGAVLLALLVLERSEERFFVRVQREQAQFFTAAQAELGRQNEQVARAGLLAVHETSHLNLTRLVAFGPLVASAQRLAVQRCRALADAGNTAARRRGCFSELGQSIRSLPGFRALDQKAYAAMRDSTVFKIKVFDLRGVTVYSSEHAQIGEDAVANEGWRSAAAGRAANKFTHRNHFNAFERVVENRDLISTYVPVRAGPDNAVVGVFELYSDVTPFLAQIQAAASAFANNIAANEASVASTSRRNEQIVSDSSRRLLLIVGGLLVLLYGISLVIVHLGQRIIDRQRLAQEQAAAREQLWHREKMAALSTMAANVSHEVGNPLTVIACIAQMLPERKGAPDDPNADLGEKILEQTARIARMMRRISDFTAARSEAPEVLDVNPMLASVCEFQSFDRRLTRTAVQFVPGNGLPACDLVPDHLNEAMMNLLQACAALPAGDGRDSSIRVATLARDGDLVIDISRHAQPTGEAQPVRDVVADARFATVQRRVDDMRARIELDDDRLSIVLPPA